LAEPIRSRLTLSHRHNVQLLVIFAWRLGFDETLALLGRSGGRRAASSAEGFAPTIALTGYRSQRACFPNRGSEQLDAED
jgi:hypothetical protein